MSTGFGPGDDTGNARQAGPGAVVAERMPSPPGYHAAATALTGAKGWACPHCGKLGQLNRHGVLRGLAEDGTSKAAVRGQRFFCSNRGRRRGCGRTVAVLAATVLKCATVRTGPFWRFIAARLDGRSVSAAWATGGRGFSLEAAYGWWRRWRERESLVRTLLARGRDPPAGALGAVITAVYGASDPIAAFQVREQRGWPGLRS